MFIDMTADLILCNGNVITLDSSCPRAQLVAVKDGKIWVVTRNEDWKELKGSRTLTVDCHGGTVLPGFNDAHCHLLALAKRFINLDVTPARVHSISDIQKEIRKLARDLSPGTWISAEGYDEFHLVEKRHPTRWDLDKASQAHPVKLTHRSGHAHVLNSMALALVGISRETPDPIGGIIDRDLETGEPTGLLYDMGDYLGKRIPPLSEAQLEQGIYLVNQELLSSGITSVQDVSPQNDFSRWQVFQRWKEKGALKCRLSLMLGVEGFIHCQNEGLLPRLSNNGIHLGGVKIILQETMGQLTPSCEELEQIVPRIHQSNLQIAFHAVEERAVDAACAFLECLLGRIPRSGHRHRIEHCSVCKPELARRLALLGAVVVTQPAFIYYHGDRYLCTVPEQDLEYLYPVATLLKAGVKVAAGSDCPVVPLNPLVGIYAAISRRARTGETIALQQRISAPQALRLYTLDAAYAQFRENLWGSITPGKFADLIVLNGDPLRVSTYKISDLQVKMTIIGGEIVWARL